MSNISGAKEGGVGHPEYLDSPEANLDRVFGYLEKIWPGTKWWQKILLRGSLEKMQRLQTKDEKIATGFDIISRTEGESGVEGGIGAFSYKVDLDPVVLCNDFVLNGGGVGGRSQLVDSLLKTGIGLVKKRYLNAKYVPDDKRKLDGYFWENKEYPRREVDDPTVRLLLPKDEGWGYVDSPLSEVERLLDQRRYNEPKDEKSNISSLEKLLLKGDIDNVGGVLSEMEIVPLDKWKEGERKEEPPWMVLSVSSSEDGREAPVVRDPQMVVHLAINVEDESTGIPTSIRTDWAHTPEVGQGALMTTMDWLEGGLVDVGKRMARNEVEVQARKELSQELGAEIGDVNVELLQPEEEVLGERKSLSELWDSVVVEAVKMKDVVGVEPESVVDDPVMQKGIKELGLFEIDSSYGLGEWWNKMLLVASKNYGGMTGMKGLAELLGGGRAPFVMIGNDGPEGLQVGLGMGGVKLIGQLRGVIGEIRKSSDNDEEVLQSGSSGIYDWWKYWDDAGWKKVYGAEIEAGSVGQGATVSTMAKMVGMNRRIAQKMSAIVTKRWASFTQGRSQLSAMGRKPRLEKVPKLNKVIKKIEFWTAGSATVGSVEGGIGDVVTRRSYTKDPLLWMETAVDLIKNGDKESSEFVNALYRECGRSVDESDFRGHGVEIKFEDMQRIYDWLGKLKDGESVKKVSFGEILTVDGEIQDASVGVYLRGIGENIESAEEAKRLARVMVHLMTRMIARDGGWAKVVREGMASFVEKKTRWNLLHMMELSMLSMMRGKEIVYGEDSEKMSGAVVLQSIGGNQEYSSDELAKVVELRRDMGVWRRWSSG